MPRTRKYRLGETRAIVYTVPEQRGVDSEWTLESFVAIKPSGEEVNAEVSEPVDGTFQGVIAFDEPGTWKFVITYTTEDDSQTMIETAYARVVSI